MVSVRPRTPLFLACFLVLAIGSAAAQEAPKASVQQGGIARWSGTGAEACMIHGNRYPAIGGDCYFPVDIAAATGIHEVAVIDADGKFRTGSIDVTARECAEMDIDIDDQSLVRPEGDDLARHIKERAEVLKALEAESGEARFTLPMTPPAERMPRGDDDFCATRYFNDREDGSVHTGRDYEITQGTAVHAIGAGRVLVAADHFMTGNSVFVDHGAGLVSMFFHLGKLDVASGDEVEAGQRVGSVGSTGRSTGPHLHLGARWIDQRIDPALLLGKPAALPDLGAKDTRDAKDAKDTKDSKPNE